MTKQTEIDIAYQEKTTDEDFKTLIRAVKNALSSPKGKLLCCRLKVDPAFQEFVVYQGTLTNVWGRFSLKRHDVYRHHLKKLLLTNENTKPFFTEEELL